MLSNNNARLAIVLAQSNRFSYTEFTQKCVEAGLPALTLVDWVSKVGMVSAAEVMYPGEDVAEAYTKFVHLRNGTLNDPKGLGDTIATVTAATGIDKLAELYTRLTGKDCGCKERREALNKLVPYGIQEITE